MKKSALPVRVHPSPILSFILAGIIIPIRELQIIIVIGRLIGEHAGAADSLVKKSRYRKSIIPHKFSFESARRLEGEKSVVGIDVMEVGTLIESCRYVEDSTMSRTMCLRSQENTAETECPQIPQPTVA